MIESILGIIKDTVYDAEKKFDLTCKKQAVGLIQDLSNALE